jgi:hypothetical protein
VQPRLILYTGSKNGTQIGKLAVYKVDLVVDDIVTDILVELLWGVDEQLDTFPGFHKHVIIGEGERAGQRFHFTALEQIATDVELDMRLDDERVIN